MCGCLYFPQEKLYRGLQYTEQNRNRLVDGPWVLHVIWVPFCFFWGEAAASHFDRFPFPIVCCSPWGLISSFVVSCNAVCYVLFCLMWDVTGLPVTSSSRHNGTDIEKERKTNERKMFFSFRFWPPTDPHKELSLPGYLCRVIFSHMWVISALWWEVIHLITIGRCPLPLDWGLR